MRRLTLPACVVVVMLVLLAATAAAKSGASLVSSQKVEADSLEAALRAEVEETLTYACATCHGSTSPAAGLALDGDPMALVGLASSQIDTLAQIEPGRPERSYLYMKVIDDERISGGVMPLGSRGLKPELSDPIRAWIVRLGELMDVGSPAGDADEDGEKATGDAGTAGATDAHEPGEGDGDAGTADRP